MSKVIIYKSSKICINKKKKCARFQLRGDKHSIKDLHESAALTGVNYYEITKNEPLDELIMDGYKYTQ